MTSGEEEDGALGDDGVLGLRAGDEGAGAAGGEEEDEEEESFLPRMRGSARDRRGEIMERVGSAMPVILVKCSGDSRTYVMRLLPSRRKNDTPEELGTLVPRISRCLQQPLL